MYAFVSLCGEYCNVGGPAPVYGYCLSLGLPLLLSLLSCKCLSFHLNDILIKYINKYIRKWKQNKSTGSRASFLVPHEFMWFLDRNKKVGVSESISSPGTGKGVVCMCECGGFSVFKVKVVSGGVEK